MLLKWCAVTMYEIVLILYLVGVHQHHSYSFCLNKLEPQLLSIGGFLESLSPSIML